MSNICKHIANESMNEMAIGKEEYIYTNGSMQYAYYEDGSLAKHHRNNLKSSYIKITNLPRIFCDVRWY